MFSHKITFHFSLVERFGTDFDKTMRNHCLKVFGVPLEETIDETKDGNCSFGTDSQPRIAEIFLEFMREVSLFYMVDFSQRFKCQKE